MLRWLFELRDGATAMIEIFTPLLALAPYLGLAALLAFIPADTVPNDES